MYQKKIYLFKIRFLKSTVYSIWWDLILFVLEAPKVSDVQFWKFISKGGGVIPPTQSYDAMAFSTTAL